MTTMNYSGDITVYRTVWYFEDDLANLPSLNNVK